MATAPVIADFADESQPVFASTLIHSTWDPSTWSGGADRSYVWTSASVSGNSRNDYYYDSTNNLELSIQSTLSGSTPIGLANGLSSYLAGYGSGLFRLNYSYSWTDPWSLTTTSTTTSTAVDLGSGSYTTNYSYSSSGADGSGSSQSYTYVFPTGMASHQVSSWGPWMPSWISSPVISFLGGNYQFSSGSFSSYQDLVANTTSTNHSANFASVDGGYLGLSETSQNGTTTSAVSLYHPSIGSVGASASGNLVWGALDAMPWQVAPRTGPSFYPAAIWVNGIPHVWASGQLTLTGQITDTYQGPSGATMQFSGLIDDPAIIITFTPPSGPPPDPPAPIPVVLSGRFTVWINGHAYAFAENEIVDGVFTVDRYDSSGFGSVHFSHQGSYMMVTGNCGTISVSNTFNSPSGVLTGPGYILSFSEFSGIANLDKLWVRGTLYARSEYGEGALHFLPAAGDSGQVVPAPESHCRLVLAQDGETWELQGVDGQGAFGGPFPLPQPGWGFVNNHFGHPTVPVLRVSSDGTSQLDSGANLPPSLPACVLVPPNGDLSSTRDPVTGDYLQACLFRFAGICRDLVDGSNAQVAFYLREDQKTHSRQVLQIGTGSMSLKSATIVELDPSAVVTLSGGYFNEQTLLFYRGTTEASQFPLGVTPLLPNQNHKFWRHGHPNGLSPTYVLRGQGWRYAGTEEVANSFGQGQVVVDLYHGPILGQVMRVHPQTGQESRLVTLTDSSSDALSPQTVGSLNPVRESIVFRDGTVALRGDLMGAHQQVAVTQQLNVHTISGDLDVLGNHLSFGLLNDDAGMAGALFRFSDAAATGKARLDSALGRNNAEWGWYKAGTQPGAPSQAVMSLSSTHQLTLEPPSTAAPGASGAAQTSAPLILNPAPGGVSSIPGVLRVRRGGDLSMGQYRAGGEP